MYVGGRRMPTIDLELEIAAPIEVVFDLFRSVELHEKSTFSTRERAVAGVTSGMLGLGDEVTWEAVHFGLRQRLTIRITAFDRPNRFRDSMVSGAFRRFDHDHVFTRTTTGTQVSDRFDFTSPCGPLGWMANRLFLTSYMRNFLERRMHAIKAIAESGAQLPGPRAWCHE